MKYGIPANHGGRISLEQVVDIPSPLPNWAASPEAFLAKMFPGFSGFVHVGDDNVSGAVSNGDGTYTNPTSAPVPVVQDGAKNLKAIIRGRAAGLVKRGSYAEALALLKTIGE